MSKRARPRVHVRVPVTFTGDQISGKGTMTNLAISGCEVESDAALPVKTHLCLHIHQPEGRLPVVVTLAIVRWVKQHRFGLEFIKFEAGAKKEFVQVLQQHGLTADPASAEEESEGR